MSAHDRDDGYADFPARGKPGRPRRVGWEHPATSEAVERAELALIGARAVVPTGDFAGVNQPIAVAALEEAKGLAESAVRELTLAIAGERQARAWNR